VFYQRMVHIIFYVDGSRKILDNIELWFIYNCNNLIKIYLQLILIDALGLAFDKFTYGFEKDTIIKKVYCLKYKQYKLHYLFVFLF